LCKKYKHTKSQQNIWVLVRATNFDNWCPERPYIHGGGLSGKYYLENVHFHWSQSYLDGSEHHIGGRSFVHMLHVHEGYDLDDSAWPANMFAAVAIFVKVDNDGRNFRNLTNFRPHLLLPHDTSTFYRYNGSLSTPPCSEKVTWFVLTNPISITDEQVLSLCPLSRPAFKNISQQLTL
ncbi:unnamed protein product, partial [Gongylonema pulchrum]|uniref:carbonic anhydrase n=1 Tax=Gongylonema pulchrum TaxID=637853 RepID=A0A183EK92_9BILA